jgi:protein-S-isoprenylcysteine O-methyltransferase Ste14
MKWLLARAVVAFLVLPGVVAFLVPWLLVRRQVSPLSFNRLGFIPLTLGMALLLWCVRTFYVEGRGTLAPWDPPRRLVVTGVYQLSRNPMYVAVVLVLLGWALGFRARSLTIYLVGVMMMFQLRVVFGEEPWLARKHGDEWLRYKAQVPRWLGTSSTPCRRGGGLKPPRSISTTG